MARKKTITRDQILTAAYEVVAKEGFSRFTARNIAAKMKCSTQPIYLEFKNMEDLKTVLVADIINNMLTKFLEQELTGNRLIDLGVNFINFANKEKQLYKALILEGEVSLGDLNEYSYDYFVNTLIKDTEYEGMPVEQTQSLYMGFWIVVTGLASLVSTNVVDSSEEKMTELLQSTFQMIKDQEPIDLSFKSLIQ
jgi:Transcriptional regulator